MPRKLDPLLLADFASGQWGMFTTAQARDLGVTPQQVARLADAGTLERVRYGVYRIAGLPDDGFEQVRAAWLALNPDRSAGQRLSNHDPGGVISHLTAAQLRGLGDLPPDAIDITLPRRRQSRGKDVRYHVANLRAEDWNLVDGLPTTTAATTIATLARCRLDGDHLARIVRDAMITGQIALDETTRALRPYAHQYGAPLGDADTMLDRLLDSAGLPTELLALAAQRTPRPTVGAVAELLKAVVAAIPPNSQEARTFQALVAGAGMPDPDLLSKVLAGASPADVVRVVANHRDG